MLPQNHVEYGAIYLTVNNKYARNIYDPIVLQTEYPDARHHGVCALVISLSLSCSTVYKMEHHDA